MLKQMVLARFEPVVTRFAPCKIPKCLEIELFWDHFESVLMDFSHFHHMYASRTLGPVWWSHLDLGRGV